MTEKSGIMSIDRWLGIIRKSCFVPIHVRRWEKGPIRKIIHPHVKFGQKLYPIFCDIGALIAISCREIWVQSMDLIGLSVQLTKIIRGGNCKSHDLNNKIEGQCISRI